MFSPQRHDAVTSDCVIIVQIIKECACVSNDMTFTRSQFASVDYKACGNQTSPEDGSLSMNYEGFKDVHCLYSFRQDVVSCNEQCDLPCSEYVYQASSSQSSDWPDVVNQLAFYIQYIREKPYADKFAAYADVIDLESVVGCFQCTTNMIFWNVTTERKAYENVSIIFIVGCSRNTTY